MRTSLRPLRTPRHVGTDAVPETPPETRLSPRDSNMGVVAKTLATQPRENKPLVRQTLERGRIMLLIGTLPPIRKKQMASPASEASRQAS